MSCEQWSKRRTICCPMVQPVPIVALLGFFLSASLHHWSKCGSQESPISNAARRLLFEHSAALSPCPSSTMSPCRLTKRENNHTLTTLPLVLFFLNSNTNLTRNSIPDWRDAKGEVRRSPRSEAEASKRSKNVGAEVPPVQEPPLSLSSSSSSLPSSSPSSLS